MNKYIDDGISKVLDQNGAFFAFNDKQFNTNKKEGVQYVKLGAGLIGPKDKEKIIFDQLDAVIKKGIDKELKEKTKKDIIWDAFANYECQIIGSPDDAIDSLFDYPFTEKEIRKEWVSYFDYCVEKDLF
jgi:hypothetical protein